MSTNQSTTGSNTVDTYGWDTVSAIRYVDVNNAIVSEKSSPANFSQEEEDPLAGTYTVSGNFGDWQLVEGGDGQNVQMSIPISDGAIKTSTQTLSYDATAIIQVNLAFLPQPDGTSTPKQQLKVNLEAKDSSHPIAVVLSVNLSSGDSSLSTYINAGLTTWLNANLDTFNNVFSVVDLNEQADNGAMQWLKPTYISYAVTDMGSLDTSIFGLLAMTNNNPPVPNHQVSPFAIPDGANGGFLIAPSLFLTQMVMPGLPLIFKDCSVDDFYLTNDSMQLTNNKGLSFIDFEVDDDGDTKPASIGTGNFTVTLQGNYIILELHNIQIDWKPGITLSVSYKGTGMLALSDDKQHFIVKTPEYNANEIPVDDNPSVQAVIQVSEGREIFDTLVEIGVSVAGVVIGAVIGGALDALIAPAAEAAVTATEETLETTATEAVINTTTQVAEITAENSATLVAEISGDATTASVEAEASLATDATSQEASGWFRRLWPKLLGAIVGGSIGVGIGYIPKIIATFSPDMDEAPTLDNLMTESLSPIDWTNSEDATLDSAQLNSSLQLGIQYTFTNPTT